jgi:hypothetical protein
MAIPKVQLETATRVGKNILPSESLPDFARLASGEIRVLPVRIVSGTHTICGSLFFDSQGSLVFVAEKPPKRADYTLTTSSRWSKEGLLKTAPATFAHADVAAWAKATRLIGAERLG